MFIVDNNLSPKIAVYLADIYPKSVHVFELGFSETDDETIWKYAKEYELNILTKDKDFLHLLNLKGTPPKIIWLRCGNMPTSRILEILKNSAISIQQFLSSDKALLEIH